jgi:GNAT superfamily N-acetyltransferase
VSAAEGLELEIRLATPDDAGAIAALWAECEPGSVWAKLGPRLAEVHFRAYCDSAHELAVTAWCGGALTGACLGTDRPADYGRALYVDHVAELARAFAREAISRPRVVATLARRLAPARHGRRTGGGSGPAAALAELGIAPDRACYMSDFFVGVSARGQQLGTRMLERFCDEMARRGLDACIAHTTADNVASQVAQRRAGFELVLERGSDTTFLRRLAR